MSDLRIGVDHKSKQFVVHRFNGWGGRLVAHFPTLDEAKEAYPGAYLDSGFIRDSAVATADLSSRSDGLGSVPSTAQLAGPTRSQASRAWVWITTGLLIALIVGGILWGSDHSQGTNQASALSGQLSAANTSLATTQSQLDAANQAAQHPTLVIENVPSTISANGWTVAGVPDTFTYHLSFTSNVEVEYAFLSDADYVHFANCTGSRFVSSDGSLNRLGVCLAVQGGAYAQPSSAIDDSVWGAGTSVSVTFHQAEGCAGWVRVMFPRFANQAAVVTPNISVTYRPAPTATPPCA